MRHLRLCRSYARAAQRSVQDSASRTRGGGVLAACGSRSIGPPVLKETARLVGTRHDGLIAESQHAEKKVLIVITDAATTPAGRRTCPGGRRDSRGCRPHPRNKRPAITVAAHACRQLMTTTASASCGSTACPHHGFGCTADAWSA